MAGNPGDRSLKETPTWAVAVVCAVIVIISVMMEHGIHRLGKWFQKRQKKAMSEALEKIKAELMLLGFISLLLTVGQRPISKICIPAKAGSIMLPCKVENAKGNEDGGHRKLLWYGETTPHRILASSTTDYCSRYKDKVPLISQSGIHQLHIFIFVLAVFHVLYSVLTMALGQAKIKKWKAWELETTSLEYQFSNDPSRFRFTHQTSFVKRHVGLSSTLGIRWIVAFFRQFYGSVSKVDYLTMRHGFINAHLSLNSKFDFHKYIKRSLEDDFKVVVGISLPLWFMAILILLLDVYGLGTLIWISFVPLIVLLLVGMKLEIVIMEMAREIQDRTAVIKGTPIVEPNDKFFWFNRPQWILFLIHLTLFENAFQMAHFLWTWSTFGLKSCINENLAFTFLKVIMGLALQFLCSYITFPLYALVTQMGSHMKKAIFEEQTAKALMKWQQAAKEKKRLRDAGISFTLGYKSGETTPSRGTSPMHLLHKYKSNSVDPESTLSSPKSYRGDTDFPDIEAPKLFKLETPKETRRPTLEHLDVDVANNDFSFSIQ
ncbi:MLO protein homolog 1-like isoform X1 [Typha angustifolia]|uniref:MLO protein homolog 1-like isoform X1 n=1 Tax=Typha angustifolia TaxID=59011 RepID=UPI003C2F1FCF